MDFIFGSIVGTIFGLYLMGLIYADDLKAIREGNPVMSAKQVYVCKKVEVK